MSTKGTKVTSVVAKQVCMTLAAYADEVKYPPYKFSQVERGLTVACDRYSLHQVAELMEAMHFSSKQAARLIRIWLKG